MLETRQPYSAAYDAPSYSGPRHPSERESSTAKSIEEQTVKLPSDLFLWSAVGAIGASLLLQVSGRKHESQFIGQWVPTILIFGMYNKMVKLLGSE